MRPSSSSAGLHAPLKALSAVVIAAMAASIVYAGWISITYWSGIGV